MLEVKAGASAHVLQIGLAPGELASGDATFFRDVLPERAREAPLDGHRPMFRTGASLSQYSSAHLGDVQQTTWRRRKTAVRPLDRDVKEHTFLVHSAAVQPKVAASRVTHKARTRYQANPTQSARTLCLSLLVTSA